MDKSILHQSLTVFYRDEGPDDTPGHGNAPGINARAGDVLVLIHGFAEDGAIWDRQTEYLKKNHRLLVPDLPGSGRSSALPRETTMDELADFIKAVLDAEAVGQAILIGHSMGGYITLAFAEKYPGRLKAFGFFHSTAYADTEEKRSARRKGIEFIRNNGAALFIKQSIPNLFAEGSRAEHSATITKLTDRYANIDPGSLIYYYRAMIDRPDRTETLKRTALPVLFIIGGQDPTIPVQSSLEQTHMPQLALIHVLVASGHMGMLEEGAAGNAILEKFLLFLQQGY